MDLKDNSLEIYTLHHGDYFTNPFVMFEVKQNLIIKNVIFSGRKALLEECTSEHC